MDKITHQVRAEHWARILNECMNSGMPKTAWCRANGISEKQFFYWQRILRREAYEASQNPSLPAVTDPSLPAVTEAGQLSPVQQSVSFAEIKLPAVSPDASPVFHPDLVIRKGKLVLEIAKVYIAAGYTDLRRGIDGLASIVKFNFQLDPYEKDILFLFCGRRSDRIKGLVWEGDGFLLLYKRLELGGFSWPRTKEEALEITPEQYRALMQGLEIVSRHPIQEVQPSDLL